jgi:CO/xanthine dehydrogenase FAD-binding subunit
MEAFWPVDVDEALDVLDGHPEATVVAGGTDLMVEVNYGLRSPTAVVGISRIGELAGVEPGWIGASTTWARLVHAPWSGLAQASRTVGSPQIRNAGTIGGNLGTASPAGDGLTFLAAIDATIEVASKRDGPRSMSWDSFLTGPKRTALRAGELILGARFSQELPSRQAFGKVGARNAMVISVVSACLTRSEDGTTRIALGSVGPTTMRARLAEEMISDESHPSEAAIAEFRRLVSEEVRPITDHRSSAAYRRHAAGVLAGRLLERCLQ